MTKQFDCEYNQTLEEYSNYTTYTSQLVPFEFAFPDKSYASWSWQVYLIWHLHFIQVPLLTPATRTLVACHLLDTDFPSYRIRVVSLRLEALESSLVDPKTRHVQWSFKTKSSKSDIPLLILIASCSLREGGIPIGFWGLTSLTDVTI